MLRQVAEGVLVHESEWVQSNAVVVQGLTGVLLVDPGIYASEVAAIANDLAGMGETVVAGFSTHPHWDHLLWHAGLGAAPRYATAGCASTARERLSGGVAAVARAVGIPEQVSLDLIGRVAGLPAETSRIPWDGPRVRIVEHQAHAPGHAALLIDERGVLIAGDMLSDALIPMLDLSGAADPVEDYLAALRLLDGVAGDVEIVVPGHGSVGGPAELRARIERDRAYVLALREGRAPDDPRLGPTARLDWMSGVHERQVQQLARRNERDRASG